MNWVYLEFSLLAITMLFHYDYPIVNKRLLYLYAELFCLPSDKLREWWNAWDVLLLEPDKASRKDWPGLPEDLGEKYSV